MWVVHWQALLAGRAATAGRGGSTRDEERRVHEVFHFLPVLMIVMVQQPLQLPAHTGRGDQRGRGDGQMYGAQAMYGDKATSSTSWDPQHVVACAC